MDRTSPRRRALRLDQTDLKILKELQENARISIAELAKRVALTPTPCARRIQLLEAAGVIKGYAAVLDQTSLGLPVTAFVEVRLTREGKDEVREFESAIRGYPEVMECWAMSGGYDYLLRVVTADLDGYNGFLRDRLLTLGCVDHVETGFALQRVVARTALPLEQLNGRKTV
ncbi:MAG TPA: Lrp/AsnC family transcriptional regulator [Gammaproteobacteria bacterium]